MDERLASSAEDDEPINPFAPPLRQLDELLVPGATFGDGYRIHAIIGDGATGFIASATHPTLGRVALKLLRPEHAKSAPVVERFLVEAKLVAKVQSPHVVTVHEVATASDGRPYFAMELLRGMDLATMLEGHGRLDVKSAIRWAIQACDGLAEVHALGLVHRDIKPENLFLAKPASGPTILKLVDFGVVRVLDDEARAALGVKATEGIVGTPRYMAPEQIQEDLTVDGRADIWALGAVLYEMLTGKCVFEGSSFVDTLRNVLVLDPAPPSLSRPEISANLDAIVKRCLAKAAGDRFGSAAELADALEKALGEDGARDSIRTPVPLPVSDRPAPPPRASTPPRSSTPAKTIPAAAPSSAKGAAARIARAKRPVSPPAPAPGLGPRKLIAPLAIVAAVLCAALAYVQFTNSPASARDAKPSAASMAGAANDSATSAPSAEVATRAEVPAAPLPALPVADSAAPSATVSASASAAPKRPPWRKRDPSSVL